MKSEADAHVDAVLIGGREERAIVIVDYDLSWPQRFEALARTILDAAGELRTPAKDVHVHVFRPGDDAVPPYRELRDWLRIDETDRALYANTKKMLARKQWSDMNDYADAKTDVISQILAHAKVSRELRSAGNSV